MKCITIGIRPQVILFVFFTMVLSLVVLALSASFYNARFILNLRTERLQVVASLKAAQVQQVFSNLYYQLYLMSARDQIVMAVGRYRAGNNTDENWIEVNSYLNYTFSASTSVTAVAIYDTAGALVYFKSNDSVAYTNYNQALFPISRDQPYINSRDDNVSGFITSPRLNNTGYLMTYSFPIMGNSSFFVGSSRLYGFISILTTTNSLRAIVEDTTGLEDSGLMYLVGLRPVNGTKTFETISAMVPPSLSSKVVPISTEISHINQTDTMMGGSQSEESGSGNKGSSTMSKSPKPSAFFTLNKVYVNNVEMSTTLSTFRIQPLETPHIKLFESQSQSNSASITSLTTPTSSALSSASPSTTDINVFGYDRIRLLLPPTGKKQIDTSTQTPMPATTIRRILLNLVHSDYGSILRFSLFNQSRVTVGFARVESEIVSWIVVISEPISSVYAPVTTMRNVILIAAFGSLGVLTPLVVFLVNKGVQPIYKLKQAAEDTALYFHEISPEESKTGSGSGMGSGKGSGNDATAIAATNSSDSRQGLRSRSLKFLQNRNRQSLNKYNNGVNTNININQIKHENKRTLMLFFQKFVKRGRNKSSTSSNTLFSTPDSSSLDKPFEKSFLKSLEKSSDKSLDKLDESSSKSFDKSLSKLETDTQKNIIKPTIVLPKNGDRNDSPLNSNAPTALNTNAHPTPNSLRKSSETTINKSNFPRTDSSRKNSSNNVTKHHDDSSKTFAHRQPSSSFPSPQVKSKNSQLGNEDPKSKNGLIADIANTTTDSSNNNPSSLSTTLNTDNTTQPTEHNEAFNRSPSRILVPPHVNIKDPRYFTDELVSLQYSFNRMADELEKQYLHLEDMVRERTKELEDAKDQAMNANQAKSLFIANITHELRTPLNGILGMTAVSLTESDPNKVKRSLRVISKSGEVLLHLINDLLTYSKNQVGNIKMDKGEFVLGEIIQSINNSSQMRSATKYNIETKVNIEPSNAINMVVLGDKGRIAHVLLNILHNSVKFAKKDGMVTFNIKCTQVDNHYVNLDKPVDFGIMKPGVVEFIDTVNVQSGNGFNGSGYNTNGGYGYRNRGNFGSKQKKYNVRKKSWTEDKAIHDNNNSNSDSNGGNNNDKNSITASSSGLLSSGGNSNHTKYLHNLAPTTTGDSLWSEGISSQLSGNGVGSGVGSGNGGNNSHNDLKLTLPVIPSSESPLSMASFGEGAGTNGGVTSGPSATFDNGNSNGNGNGNGATSAAACYIDNLDIIPLSSESESNASHHSLSFSNDFKHPNFQSSSNSDVSNYCSNNIYNNGNYGNGNSQNQSKKKNNGAVGKGANGNGNGKSTSCKSGDGNRLNPLAYESFPKQLSSKNSFAGSLNATGSLSGNGSVHGNKPESLNLGSLGNNGNGSGSDKGGGKNELSPSTSQTHSQSHSQDDEPDTTTNAINTKSNTLVTYSEARTCVLRFEVTDQGPGINPNIVEHVFEPFVQEDQALSRRFGGAGLGLSICKQLVELMGGNIDLINKPGVGLTVVFELPLYFTRMFGKTPSANFVFGSDAGVKKYQAPDNTLTIMPTNYDFSLQPTFLHGVSSSGGDKQGVGASFQVRELPPSSAAAAAATTHYPSLQKQEKQIQLLQYQYRQQQLQHHLLQGQQAPPLNGANYHQNSSSPHPHPSSSSGKVGFSVPSPVSPVSPVTQFTTAYRNTLNNINGSLSNGGSNAAKPKPSLRFNFKLKCSTKRNGSGRHNSERSDGELRDSIRLEAQQPISSLVGCSGSNGNGIVDDSTGFSGNNSSNGNTLNVSTASVGTGTVNSGGGGGGYFDHRPFPSNSTLTNANPATSSEYTQVNGYLQATTPHLAPFDAPAATPLSMYGGTSTNSKPVTPGSIATATLKINTPGIIITTRGSTSLANTPSANSPGGFIGVYSSNGGMSVTTPGTMTGGGGAGFSGASARSNSISKASGVGSIGVNGVHSKGTPNSSATTPIAETSPSLHTTSHSVPLPLSQSSISENSHYSQQVLPTLSPKSRILVAEDNLINQDVIRRMLKLEGIKDIDLTVNGEQAVYRVEESLRMGNFYDLIFLDIQMPRMDGLQAARIIRDQLMYTHPIVALTAYADQDSARQCFEAGMDNFLEKPIRREKLREVLHQYCPTTSSAAAANHGNGNSIGTVAAQTAGCIPVDDVLPSPQSHTHYQQQHGNNNPTSKAQVYDYESQMNLPNTPN